MAASTRRACGAWLAMVLLAGCASGPLVPWSTEGVPLARVPADRAGVTDARGTFRRLFCAEAGVADSPEDCERLMPRLAGEPAAVERPVKPATAGPLRRVLFVPGLWSDCVRGLTETERLLRDAFASGGRDFAVVNVDGTSSSAGNADTIRRAVLATSGDARDTVLIGHSKGAVDILVALDVHPELQQRVAAVVSVAGAIGGSPLATRAPRMLVTLARNAPGLKCQEGDGLALESLDPVERHAWLASHRLPPGVRAYSLVAFPAPDRISRGLFVSYSLLSNIDARNDGQLLAHDQMIPGSTLLGYANADHWAIATEVSQALQGLPRGVANRNDFPRAAMLRAIVAFVAADLVADDSHGAAVPARRAAMPFERTTHVD